MHVWQSKCPLRKKKRNLHHSISHGFLHVFALKNWGHVLKEFIIFRSVLVECGSLSLHTSNISIQLPKLLKGDEETNIALCPCQESNNCLKLHFLSSLKYLKGKLWVCSSFWFTGLNILIYPFQRLVYSISALY